MKNIKVLGSGCRNCEITVSAITQAAKEANVEVRANPLRKRAILLQRILQVVSRLRVQLAVDVAM